MKKTKLKVAFISFALLLLPLSIISCSSAPKRSMMETTIYNSSSSFLESANSCILTGDYDKANFLLGEAFKTAMSIDNYDLLTSVSLTRVSLNLSYMEPDFDGAEAALKDAYSYSEYSDFGSRQSALCVLAEVRIAISKAAAGDNSSNYSALIAKLEDNRKAIKGDPYNEAHFDSACGDIYKLQNNYDAAEKSYMTATKSFTDNRYLSEIGINWYKVAQVRSLSGNKQGALAALENAIYYDRLAENSLALGTDYYAKGVVLLKGNATQAEKDAATYAFNHSADIFEAAGFTDLAEKSKNQL